MNKQRRAAISKIADELRALGERITDLEGEEQDAFDNLPEGLQDSERGNAMTEAVDTLNSAVSELEGVIETIETLGNE